MKIISIYPLLTSQTKYWWCIISFQSSYKFKKIISFQIDTLSDDILMMIIIDSHTFIIREFGRSYIILWEVGEERSQIFDFWVSAIPWSISRVNIASCSGLNFILIMWYHYYSTINSNWFCLNLVIFVVRYFKIGSFFTVENIPLPSIKVDTTIQKMINDKKGLFYLDALSSSLIF